MFWALWAHTCRLFPAAVTQWSEMVVKRTGPQVFVWTEKLGLHFPHWENKLALAHYYANTKVAAKLVYLSDIFSQLNQLISLQGRNSNKVLTFKRTLALWTKRSQEKRRDRFPLLYDILDPPRWISVTLSTLSTSHNWQRNLSNTFLSIQERGTSGFWTHLLQMMLLYPSSGMPASGSFHWLHFKAPTGLLSYIPGVNQDSPLWPQLSSKPEIDSGKCWRLPREWTFHPFHADWLVSH